MSDNKVYKPRPISGFPEWLPEYRAVEMEWMDRIRAVFESYGFCNIETPVVEELDVLGAKVGDDTQKEIYTLTRLHADPTAKDEARLALHFDLTVPMARYVAQHFGNLVFPFKRYQIQRSYRGERPQKGRYREFYQCDVDVIGVDSLPLHFDAELPAVLYAAYAALDIPPVELHINNRKLVIGYLSGLGIDETLVPKVTTLLDKCDKIGAEKVAAEITALGISADTVERALKLVGISSTDDSFAAAVKNLGVSNDMFNEGVEELAFVMRNLAHLPKGAAHASLGVIRGLDYYTGTVLEARFTGEKLAIGGGGRYEDLASAYINRKLPGIGLSIGLTRLFGMLMDKGLIQPGRRAPTDVLVVLPDEARRAEAAETANTLRARGLNVELYHTDAKIKNQLAYAEKKGARYVWFPPFKDGQPHEVKDMTSGEQVTADPQNHVFAAKK